MQPANTLPPKSSRSRITAPHASVIALLLLVVGELVVSARAIELEHWAKGASTLVMLGAAGALCGFVLGRARVPDLLSHLWAVVFGLGISVLASAYRADDLGVPFLSRVRYISDQGTVWMRNVVAGQRADQDLIFVTALGVLTWLVGYSAAWFLFRRGWILPAVVLPGMLIVISVTNGGAGSSTAALLYVVLAMALAAVQVSRLRSAAWQRAGLPFGTIAWRASAIGGTIIAVTAVLLVWSAPFNPPEGVLNSVADRLDRPMTAAQSAWNDLARRLSPNKGGGESFAAFDDQFQMGGELNLSDDPVAVLQADQPHYLAAQRYSVYTGHGWSSDVPIAFDSANGDEPPTEPPSISFHSGQSIYLTDDVLTSRELAEGTIRILTPTGDRLLTIEAYLSASERVSATMSWREVTNEPFDLTQLSQRELPVEIRQLAMLIRQAEFASKNGSGAYVATDSQLNRQIQREIESLASRFLQVGWSIDGEGRAQVLYVTGYLPNYDDVDSVTPDQSLSAGDVYDVTGWQSDASARDLRQAATDYPPYITGRYLSLPDTVTDRTRELAANVAGGEPTPFDAALAIQDYLRSTYPYDEKISGPSSTQDAVDYFLFDEQRGYCEYFASSMVVMLRSLDIPARIVAGFREVPYDAGVDGYLYREKQAHTWVEVYFPEYGWIPFEPTPAASPFDYHGSNGQPADKEETPSPDLQTPTPHATVEAQPTGTPEAGVAQVANTDDRNDGGVSGMRIAGLAAALVGAAALISFLLYRRRSRFDAPGARLYARLVRASLRAGVQPTASTTPRELAARFGRAVPTVRHESSTISQLYRKELYGGQPLTDEDQAYGQAASRLIQRAVSMRWLKRLRRSKGVGKG